MKKLFIVLSIFLIPVAALAISSDPTETCVGARPMGMGRAFLGMQGDGSNLFLNPAGLGNSRSFKLVSMSGKLLNDVDYITLGVANPFNFGVVGLSYVSQGVAGIQLTSAVGNTIEATGQSTDYLNSVMMITLAREFPFPIPVLKDSNMGVNLKYYSQGFSGASGSLEGGSGTGFDMDLAFQFEPSPFLTWGINMQNILSLGFNWGTGRKEDIATIYKLGGAFKVLGRDGWKDFPNDLTITVDTDLTAEKSQVWHVGCEFWPGEYLAIRGGVDQSAGAGGVANNLTAGVGLKAGGFTFDYAYHQYGDISGNSTSYFSIGYVGRETFRWVEQRPTPVPPPPVELKEAPVVPDTGSGLSPEEELMAAKIRAYIRTLQKKLASAKTAARKKKLKLMIKAEQKRLKALLGE